MGDLDGREVRRMLSGKCSRCDGSGNEEHGLFGSGLIEEFIVYINTVNSFPNSKMDNHHLSFHRYPIHPHFLRHRKDLL